jgi:hypothetical protein
VQNASTFAKPLYDEEKGTISPLSLHAHVLKFKKIAGVLDKLVTVAAKKVAKCPRSPTDEKMKAEILEVEEVPQSAPPHIPRILLSPSYQSNRFGIFYTIFHVEIKMFFVILHKTKEMWVSVKRFGLDTITITVKFQFEPTQINSLVASIGQIFNYITHLISENVSSHTFPCPFRVHN